MSEMQVLLETLLTNRINDENLKQNKDFSEISNIMNICENTVNRYLKQGNKLGWCKYDASKELKPKNKNTRKYSKPIKMLNKEMVLITMFSSLVEAEKQSMQLLGIKLNISSMSEVCSGKRKFYKGYIFQHITKKEYQMWLEENKIY
jgi:hypothetical protein